MSDTISADILCVDDEPAVLEGLQLNLRKTGNVSVAVGGKEGLAWLASHTPPAVVVSDMRMPGMDGVEFLSRFRESSPDTTRLLLTGQADLTSAIDAVNRGAIFRFLTKPCPKSDLVSAVTAGIEQHRLVTAEKVLLEQTLKGCAQALVDLLALADPVGFGRAQRIRHLAVGLSVELGSAPTWQMDIAGLLAQVGCVTLDPELGGKLRDGKTLDKEEQNQVDRLPAVAVKLLQGIPRLEEVRGLLNASLPDQLGSGKGDAWAQGGRILRLATELEPLAEDTNVNARALAALKARWQSFDPDLAAALQRYLDQASGPAEVQPISVGGLHLGLIFAEDVRTKGGMMLVARGSSVTEGLMEKLSNFKSGSILEPLMVRRERR
jgi:CheY-like chemotaxis protein